MLRIKKRPILAPKPEPVLFIDIIIVIKFLIVLCVTIHIQFTCQNILIQNLEATVCLSIDPIYAGIAVLFFRKALYTKASSH